MIRSGMRHTCLVYRFEPRCRFDYLVTRFSENESHQFSGRAIVFDDEHSFLGDAQYRGTMSMVVCKESRTAISNSSDPRVF